ncbi:transposable element Tcb1 transposase [Trichonephila clavipes]|nr:transposable element Tcb1 transposase [Trichonephila clavipes]
MSSQRGQTSAELRKLILKHTEDGKFVGEISDIVKRSHSTVHDIIKRYKTNNQKEVLFTDDSKFNIFGSDGKSYVWRKSNEELRRQNLKPTVKHDGGLVMVWESFSATGPGALNFVEGRMDQNVYLDILKTNLPLRVEKHSLGNNWRFYQDNDPKHKAYRLRSWFL